MSNLTVPPEGVSIEEVRRYLVHWLRENLRSRQPDVTLTENVSRRLAEGSWAAELLDASWRRFVWPSPETNVASSLPDFIWERMKQQVIAPCMEDLRHSPTIRAAYQFSGADLFEVVLQALEAAQNRLATPCTTEGPKARNMTRSEATDLPPAWQDYQVRQTRFSKLVNSLSDWLKDQLIHEKSTTVCHYYDAMNIEKVEPTLLSKVETAYPKLKTQVQSLLASFEPPQGVYLTETGAPGPMWDRCRRRFLQAALDAQLPGGLADDEEDRPEAEVDESALRKGYLYRNQHENHVRIVWTAQGTDQLTLMQRKPGETSFWPVDAAPLTSGQFYTRHPHGILMESIGTYTFRLYRRNDILDERTFRRTKTIQVQDRTQLVTGKTPEGESLQFVCHRLTLERNAPPDAGQRLLINGQHIPPTKENRQWCFYTLPDEPMTLGCDGDACYEFVIGGER